MKYKAKNPIGSVFGVAGDTLILTERGDTYNPVADTWTITVAISVYANDTAPDAGASHLDLVRHQFKNVSGADYDTYTNDYIMGVLTAADGPDLYTNRSGKINVRGATKKPKTNNGVGNNP